MNRSSVAIAEVVRDLRAGHVRSLNGDPLLVQESLNLARKPGPVVDATAIYTSLATNPKPVYVYEDHPHIAPPWESAIVSYVNEHGNVIAMSLSAEELTKGDRSPRWGSENDLDWSRVRWLTSIIVWAGGISDTDNQSYPTSGPLHMWQHAVYESGEPADIRWTHLMVDYPMENWDMAGLVVLGALNYMNCRNVDIVEPARCRAEARRIARTGVRVTTINVFPVGKSTRSVGVNPGLGTPLTSVRGHFSHYGPDYGKGLLFGRLAGRFWIPQHARGDKALGETEHEYVLRPEPGR